MSSAIDNIATGLTLGIGFALGAAIVGFTLAEGKKAATHKGFTNEFAQLMN